MLCLPRRTHGAGVAESGGRQGAAECAGAFSNSRCRFTRWGAVIVDCRTCEHLPDWVMPDADGMWGRLD